MGEQKTIEARKQGRQKPAVCGTQKSSKNTGQYLQDAKLLISLFFCFLFFVIFTFTLALFEQFQFLNGLKIVGFVKI